MNFDDFLNIITDLKSTELPAGEAHSKVMDLAIRKQIFSDVNHRNKAKDSAVLCLIYPDENRQSKMVFIKRKTYNGHHSGQIAFPGGKKEQEDLSPEHTALREANEEVGIDTDKVMIIKKLSPVYIPISNYKVQAFLAVSYQRPDFVKQEEEVEDILEFPLIDFLNNPLEKIQKSYYEKVYNLYAFKTEKYLIWGATAMILSEIVDLINKKMKEL